MHPTVIITGANGFVGAFLVDYFTQKQWKVKAFARNPIKSTSPLVAYHAFEMPDNIDESAFTGVDYLIHCAVAKHAIDLPNSDEINIEGTNKLLELSRKHKLKKFVFFSTMSAHDQAKSHYGKHKLLLESTFDLTQDVVLKPGLIMGQSGGLFSNIKETIQKSKFVPMIDGGKQPIQTIHVLQLAEVIHTIFEKSLSGCFYLGETTPITMKAFYRGIAQALNQKRTFVPLPSFLVGIGLRMAELFKIKLAVGTENLQGLKALREFDTQPTSEALGIKFKSFDDNIRLIMD
mgnify:CR=1 FL=1